MRDRQNPQLISSDAVDQGKRESTQRKSAVALAYWLANEWRIEQKLSHALRLCFEFSAETPAIVLAVLHRRRQLARCSRVKYRCHFFSNASSWRKTSSAGMHCTCPDSISPARRSTSFSHADSTSGSGGPSSSSWIRAIDLESMGASLPLSRGEAAWRNPRFSPVSAGRGLTNVYADWRVLLVARPVGRLVRGRSE